MTTTLIATSPTAATAQTAPAYQSVNPYNGKVVKTFETFSDKQLEEKLAAAARCFETWRHTSYAERAVIVAKAAAILQAKADEFARTMTLEMGKRINEARGEVEFSSRFSPTTPRTPSASSPRSSSIRPLERPTWKAARSA